MDLRSNFKSATKISGNVVSVSSKIGKVSSFLGSGLIGFMFNPIFILGYTLIVTLLVVMFNPEVLTSPIEILQQGLGNSIAIIIYFFALIADFIINLLIFVFVFIINVILTVIFNIVSFIIALLVFVVRFFINALMFVIKAILEVIIDKIVLGIFALIANFLKDIPILSEIKKLFLDFKININGKTLSVFKELGNGTIEGNIINSLWGLFNLSLPTDWNLYQPAVDFYSEIDSILPSAEFEFLTVIVLEPFRIEIVESVLDFLEDFGIKPTLLEKFGWVD